MDSELEFMCGHTGPRQADRFSRYEDGYIAHEAGHVLARYGKREAALKCMEFALECGVVWADDDVAVIEQSIERNIEAAPRLRESVVAVPPAATPSGGGRQFAPPVRRLRRSTALFAAAALVGVVSLSQNVLTLTTASPEQLNSLVLQSVPEGEPRQLPLVQGDVTLPPEPEPSAGASHSAAPAEPVGGDPVEETVTTLRGPNRKGGISTAYVPRERGSNKNESRMRWTQVKSSRLVTTLQSPADAACVWQFRGDDGTPPEGHTSQIAVEPGRAQKVEVPVKRWRNVTVVAETEGAGGDCFVVDPVFESTDGKDAPPPRPVSTVADPWPASPTPSQAPSSAAGETPSPAATSPAAEKTPTPSAEQASDGLLQSAGPGEPAKE